MRSSTEATRLSRVQNVAFMALNMSPHCDSELQVRSERTGLAARARFAAVHASTVGTLGRQLML
jgi:hypothetical protein